MNETTWTASLIGLGIYSSFVFVTFFVCLCLLYFGGKDDS